MFLFIFLITSSILAEEIWNSSFEKGMQSARENNLPVVIDFYTDWCKYCEILENKIFPDPEVSKELEQFQKIRINGEENKDLIKKFQITGYPTVLFLDSKGGYLGRVVGLPSARDLANRLKIAYEKRNLEEDLLKKVQQEPNSLINNFNLGIYYYQTNNYDRASEFFLKAHQIKPEEPTLPKKREALFLLGVMNIYLERYSECISLWTLYMQSYPEMDKGYPLYYRAMSYYKTGKQQEALSDLEECYEQTADPQVKAMAKDVLEKAFAKKTVPKD